MLPSMSTASAELHTPAAGRAGSWLSPTRLAHTRDVLRELISRDVKLRYRGSYFGMLWTLLNPIAELAVLLFIFGSVLPLQIPNYAAFLFTGLLVYTWFQSSLFFATVAVVSNRDLIRRPNVPLSGAADCERGQHAAPLPAVVAGAVRAARV